LGTHRRFGIVLDASPPAPSTTLLSAQEAKERLRAIERLDIYRTKRDAAPVFVFIHGGAWLSGRSKDFAAPAEMFLAVGAHYVVPDFAWVQDVGGSLKVLADQVRRAIAWVYNNATHLGIDPNQIYIGGQSSGGHLAASR
jgi:arylformamidase